MARHEESWTKDVGQTVQLKITAQQIASNNSSLFLLLMKYAAQINGLLLKPAGKTWS